MIILSYITMTYKIAINSAHAVHHINHVENKDYQGL